MEEETTSKKCVKCENVKNVNDFRNNNYSNTCKKCLNEMDRLRKLNLRKQKSENFMAKCERCNEQKPLKFFAKLKKNYKKKICLVCYPSFVTEQKTLWCKNQRATNINYRIKKSLAARLRTVLKKNNTTMNYIGCNIQYFREWLEYNFTEEMNWDNYGSYWSIDHIIPVCKFNLTNENEKMQCWNWSNMMPVTIGFNSAKKEIDISQINYIVKQLEKFKEEGSTTKWFSEEFLITKQIEILNLNSS